METAQEMSAHWMLVVRNRPGTLARIALMTHRFHANIKELRTEPLTGTDLSLVEVKLDEIQRGEILQARLKGLMDVQDLVAVPQASVT